MRIERHSTFKKSFKKRILPNKKLVKKTEERIRLFLKNPQNQILRDHGLMGTKRKTRSFSISGDIRIVYRRISKDHVIFLDIGTHNQVYK